MEQIDTLTIKAKDGMKIVAETGIEGDTHAIFIGAVDSEGNWIQDLAAVRPTESNAKPFEVFVWGDAEDNDFTHKFYIGENRLR